MLDRLIHLRDQIDAAVRLIEMLTAAGVLGPPPEQEEPAGTTL